MSNRPLGHQDRKPDLTVDVLARMSDVAAAEPYPQAAGTGQQRRIAQDFRIPRLAASEDILQLLPVHAVLRPRESQAAHFVMVAAGVQHPVAPIGIPDRGLAQAVLVEFAESA